MIWEVGWKRLGRGLLGALITAATATPAVAAAHPDWHGGVPFPRFDLAAALLFGLVGSTHCFGMCGPLVGLYASQLASKPSGAVAGPHLLFNVGRVFAYTNLGILLGAAGFLIQVRPWITAVVGMAAGLFVLAVGGRLLGAGGLVARLDRLLGLPANALAGIGRYYSILARSPGIAGLGGVHAFLPCPLLYVMYTSAVALGDPIRGGALLFSFSLGTVPMMWVMGALGHRLRLVSAPSWHRVFGWAVTIWGLVLIFRGIWSFGTFSSQG